MSTPRLREAGRGKSHRRVDRLGTVVDLGADQHGVRPSRPSIRYAMMDQGARDSAAAMIRMGEEILDHADPTDPRSDCGRGFRPGPGREKRNGVAFRPSEEEAHFLAPCETESLHLCRELLAQQRVAVLVILFLVVETGELVEEGPLLGACDRSDIACSGSGSFEWSGKEALQRRRWLVILELHGL